MVLGDPVRQDENPEPIPGCAVRYAVFTFMAVLLISADAAIRVIPEK